MRLSKGLDLIIFDCDGGLVDSEILAMRACRGLFAELGATPPVELWAQCLGHKQAEIFAMIEKAVGRVAPPELRAQLWPGAKALFAAELKPTPGLIEFLEALEAPRCVASSSSDPERIRFSLEVTGLIRFFEDRLSSAQSVARGKPSPILFLNLRIQDRMFRRLRSSRRAPPASVACPRPTDRRLADGTSAEAK